MLAVLYQSALKMNLFYCQASFSNPTFVLTPSWAAANICNCLLYEYNNPKKRHSYQRREVTVTFSDPYQGMVQEIYVST